MRMGKRSKERRLAETAGRRRQTIQLDGLTRRTGASFDGEETYSQSIPLRATKVSGIGLLGAYTEESDNDSEADNSANLQKGQNMVQPAAKHKMEDQLAGFLAEINAIGDDNAPKTTESTASVPAYDPHNFDPLTQGHLLPATWQAVYDEGSGYHYYWNSETNEVQWEPPPAPPAQHQHGPEPEPVPSAPLDEKSSEKQNLAEDLADEQNVDIQPAGPSLEEFEAQEEARRRREMAAKLAGLSKKERIKLLLQKNNMPVEESTVEGTSTEDLPENSMTEDLPENCSDANLREKEDPKEVTSVVPGVDGVASLVLGYDSDASDSEMGDASVDTATKLINELQDEVKHSDLTNELAANLEGNGEFSENVNSNGKETQEIFTDKDIKPMNNEFLLEEQSFDVNSKEGVAMEVEGPINTGAGSQKIDSNEDEDFVVVSKYEDVEEATSGTENVPTEALAATSDVSQQLDYNERKMDDEVLQVEDLEKKEFTVDIFAEESGNEVETGDGEDRQAPQSDVDDDLKKEELKKEAEADQLDEDSGMRKVEEEAKEKENEKEKGKGKEKDQLKNKQKDKERDKEKRSKNKDRKKDKKRDKEKKDKRHKEERSSRESDKKRRSDKVERKSSKKHSSKSGESSRHSRRSKEEVKETKPKRELTDEEKAKITEENRKALQEEIEREERLRSEYERLKKEEKEKKEEEQKKMELEKKLMEERRKEEEKRKEEEIADFAEMLLEGALDSEAVVSEVKEEKQSEVTDDMEISDNEAEDSRPPLPPLPPPEEESPFKKDSTQNDDGVDDKFYEQNEAMHSKISDLSLLLFDKLEFLEVSRKGLTTFQVLLIEMETRMNDWREGVLDSGYLLYKLEQIDAEICKYEETAAPDGWSCHWSSDNGMYYYYKEETGESTWSYPLSAASKTAHGKNSLSYSAAAAAAESPAAPEAPSAAPLENYGYGRTNLMMWRSDLIEGEKKDETTTVPEKPLEPATDPYRDPYRASSIKQEPKLPASPGPGVSDDTPLPPGEDEDTFASPWEDGNRSGASSPLPKTLQTPAFPSTSSTTITLVTAGLPKPYDADPISSATTVKAAAKLSSLPRVASDSTLLVSHSLQVQQLASQVSANISQLKQEKKKKEKRKKLASGSLPSKKLKTVSSLVQKWQQVKQKADEEMMEDSSEDEDPERSALKRIEEWKRAQIDSGRSSKNPNFEEIKGNWREKLKKK